MGSAVADRKDRTTFNRAQRRAEIDADGLNRLVALRTALEHEAALIDEAVILAKSQGRSWADIGEAFGMTRQAAYQRFGKRLGLSSEE